jgi:hypothetical protein
MTSQLHLLGHLARNGLLFLTLRSRLVSLKIIRMTPGVVFTVISNSIGVTPHEDAMTATLATAAPTALTRTLFPVGPLRPNEITVTINIQLATYVVKRTIMLMVAHTIKAKRKALILQNATGAALQTILLMRAPNI